MIESPLLGKTGQHLQKSLTKAHVPTAAVALSIVFLRAILHFDA